MRSVLNGRGWVLPLLLSFVTLLLPTSAGPAAAEMNGSPRVDVVLVLDRSGSMLKNDPQGLAVTGAQVFLDMLDPADRVAVVGFDTTVKQLLPLSPVGDGTAGRQVLERLGRPLGQWTDLKGALAEAGAILSGEAGADRQPVVLLFTDGKPEVNAAGVTPEYMSGLTELVSQMAGRGIPIFSIGLGQSDSDLLGRIASGTRAESFVATSAGQVVKLFAGVLGQIKGRQMAFSFDEDLAPGAVGPWRTLQVPPYTRLLTLSAVATAGPVELQGQAPGGLLLANLPGVKRSAGGNYVVYTIPNPPPGAWTVRLEGVGPVQLEGQLDSALRLQLQRPVPYSQVGLSQPVAVAVAVEGDPDPHTALEVWAQGDLQQPVRLEQSGGLYTGQVKLETGHLAVWAVRAGSQVARREFRVYPVEGAALDLQGTASLAGLSSVKARWRDARSLLLAGGGLLAICAGLLLLGGWNWRRMRRREELLGGRLGDLRIQEAGDEVWLSPSLTIVGGPNQGAAAGLRAQLVPSTWTPLCGLGLGRRELRVFIRQVPGTRLQINGRPPGDGRLYHGDEVTLGAATYRYSNPRIGRRPLRPLLRTRSAASRTLDR